MEDTWLNPLLTEIPLTKCRIKYVFVNARHFIHSLVACFCIQKLLHVTFLCDILLLCRGRYYIDTKLE